MGPSTHLPTHVASVLCLSPTPAPNGDNWLACPHAGSRMVSVQRKGLGPLWFGPVTRASSLLLESANHSFQCQPANWFILPPTRLSLPCRNEAISPRRRLPVPAAAGIINEDKVPAAQTISPSAPPAAASFIIRLSCRRELLNPDPCIRGLY